MMTLTNLSIGELYQLWEIGAEAMITAWQRCGHQPKIQTFLMPSSFFFTTTNGYVMPQK